MIINKKYNTKLNLKYLYYYLKSIKNHIEYTYEKGTCNKSLDQKNFNRMKIPIPPLEIQNKLITKLDSSNDKVKYMKLIIDSMKQDIETFFELTIEIENKKSETKWIEFGEVFTLEKGKLQSSKVEEDEDGDILFVSKSEINDNTRLINSDEYFDGGIFLAYLSDGIDGKIPIRYTEKKCIHSNLMFRLNLNDTFLNKLNIKYIYYFLMSIKKHIEQVYQKGSCNQSLDIKNFNRMKIQIPSIKQQNKCIEKINEMEEIIKRWENDIENILNNGSNKFLEYLEGESIKYEKDKNDKKELETDSNIVKNKIKPKTKTAII